MTSSLFNATAPTTGDIAGHAVPLRYTTVDAEYAALRSGAGVVDRSHRARMSFEGDKRSETLTGLLTNDVVGLAPGTGLYAAALTPRGKIIADVRLFARENEILVDVPPRAAAAWTAMIRKFVNPRATKYVDRTESLADVGVFGARARALVASLAGVAPEALASLPPYAHVAATIDGSPAMIIRAPDIATEGYDIVVDAASRGGIWQRALDLGGVAVGHDAWEIARVEAGRPEWGLDIDESTIPQEANFDDLHAISYTKGCYTGQETVARVHFRGHVNRHLRGLQHAGETPIPHGAQLVADAEKVVGDVRTSVMSPQHGGIALGMVRREVEPGGVVRARWEGGEMETTVVALPFPDA